MTNNIEIQTIRDKITELCVLGTNGVISEEEKKDLALLLIIERQYDSLAKQGA